MNVYIVYQYKMIKYEGVVDEEFYVFDDWETAHQFCLKHSLNVSEADDDGEYQISPIYESMPQYFRIIEKEVSKDFPTFRKL